ncbi:SDR family oxidoreductase, partial [Burkholderia gladioli]|uniref:SDR family oxidoreductase n=1 Tax=Burkholderia gladioli TaxID=28095 RepID=UPI001FC8D9B6
RARISAEYFGWTFFFTLPSVCNFSMTSFSQRVRSPKNPGRFNAYREQVEREILASIPAGRFGLAEEVASAVLHLASDESAWSVGSEIVVDGGRMLNG